MPGKRVTFPPTEPTVLTHPLLHYVACVSEKTTNLPVTHFLFAIPNMMPVNKNIAYHNCAPFSDNMKQGIKNQLTHSGPQQFSSKVLAGIMGL